jgi:serine/threonine protein kinase
VENLGEIAPKKKSKFKRLWGLKKSKNEEQSASDSVVLDEIVAGKYRKLEKLGSGAFGSVFLVENILDGKKHALKEAEASVWSKNDLMEIQVMTRLNIAVHVVSLFEAIITMGNKMFIVMRYAANGDLAKMIDFPRMKKNLL